MSLFDKIKGAAQQAKEGGQTVGKMGQLKVEMTKAQAKVGELYASIGIKAYQLYQKKELSHEGLNEMCAQIDALTKEVKANKTELDGIMMKIDIQNQDAAADRLADIAEQQSPMEDDEPR